MSDRSVPGRIALLVFLVVGVSGGLTAWAAPRDDVPTPGADAEPAEVVLAYIEAVNARDFATANAIDARPGSDLGLFSRPGRIELSSGWMGVADGERRAHVTFEARFVGDATMEGLKLWGYYLERDDSGWHIVDAGVA